MPGTKEEGEGKELLEEADIKKEVPDDVGSTAVPTESSSVPSSPSVKAAADKAILEVVEAVAASSKERRMEAEKREEEAVESMMQLERGIPPTEAGQGVETSQTGVSMAPISSAAASHAGTDVVEGMVSAETTATLDDDVAIVETAEEEEIMQVDDDDDEDENEVEGNVEAGDEAAAGTEEEEIDDDEEEENTGLGDKSASAQEEEKTEEIVQTDITHDVEETTVLADS